MAKKAKQPVRAEEATEHVEIKTAEEVQLAIQQENIESLRRHKAESQVAKSVSYVINPDSWLSKKVAESELTKGQIERLGYDVRVLLLHKVISQKVMELAKE